MVTKRRNQRKGGSRVPHMAMLAVVLLAALAAVSWQVGWLGGGNGPLLVAQVPTSLPSRGVQVEDGQIVLRRWATAHRGAMSAIQAIAAARRHPSFTWMRSVEISFPATALKADITVRNRGPMGSARPRGPDRPLHHVPVWLVTFTSPRPVNLENDGIRQYYVTQFSEAIDPVTGKSVIGFTSAVR